MSLAGLAFTEGFISGVFSEILGSDITIFSTFSHQLTKAYHYVERMLLTFIKICRLSVLSI